MTRREFLACMTLAMKRDFQPLPLGSVEMDSVSGCALDKKRRIVTAKIVASMIVHHCYTFAGTWDLSELDNLETYSKRMDLVAEEA